jgi:hypothetical protein
LAAMRRRVLCAANRSASLLDRVFPTVGLRSAHECRSAGSWDGYRTCFAAQKRGDVVLLWVSGVGEALQEASWS